MDSSILIVYEHAKAYPAYLINYTNGNGMAGGNMFHAAPIGALPAARRNPIAWGGGVKKRSNLKGKAHRKGDFWKWL